MKKYIPVIFLFLFIFSCAADESASTAEADGYIKNGLRYVEIPEKSSQIQLKVYRGDYVVFQPSESDSALLSIPGLDINETVYKSSADAGYIKMKSAGEFEFTIGGKKGTVTVTEFEAESYKAVSAEDAYNLIKTVDPVILDVRTQAEYDSGHLEGAILIPVQVLEQNMGVLEQFKDENILVYCASGNRSTVASKLLLEADFSRLYNMRYGIREWLQKGYPVE